jgi:acetylornithine deacetylase
MWFSMRKVLRQLGQPDAGCGVLFGSGAGVPSIVFGPGSIDQAHSVDEYVELAEVECASAFYRGFIFSF